MSNSRSRIPSPARSQGSLMTPRRHENPRKTRSVCSPARSNASGRLSALIREHNEDRSSFALSPIGSKSLLPDTTDVGEPKRQSWWKNLDEDSRNVMEVLKDSNAIEPHNIMEELDIEVLSQEKKRFTLDLPESSDSESIHSIIIPQKRLFREKENRPWTKQFDQFGTRETLDDKTSAAPNKSVTTATKELFQIKPRPKPVFPAALLDISANTTVSEKNLTTTVKAKEGIRKMFSKQQPLKRTSVFAKFIESDSEDEIPDISVVKHNFFDFQKPAPRRPSVRSSFSKFRDQSPTSNATLDSFDDWDQLPSSTMVENQLEAAMTGQKAKKFKLSKLSEVDSPATSNNTKTGRSSKYNDKSASLKVKSKRITKDKSLQQNTSIEATTMNSSQVIQNADEELNKINKSKSRLKSNASETTLVTRSKNKSGLTNALLRSSMNNSRNIFVNNKNVSKASEHTDNKKELVEKNVLKNYSAAENQVMDIDEKGPKLPEPVQNDNYEFNFFLEYESDDNIDEGDVNTTKRNEIVINESNNEVNVSKNTSQKIALLKEKSKSNISTTDKNISKTANEQKARQEIENVSQKEQNKTQEIPNKSKQKQNESQEMQNKSLQYNNGSNAKLNETEKQTKEQDDNEVEGEVKSEVEQEKDTNKMKQNDHIGVEQENDKSEVEQEERESEVQQKRDDSKLEQEKDESDEEQEERESEKEQEIDENLVEQGERKSEVEQEEDKNEEEQEERESEEEQEIDGNVAKQGERENEVEQEKDESEEGQEERESEVEQEKDESEEEQEERESEAEQELYESEEEQEERESEAEQELYESEEEQEKRESEAEQEKDESEVDQEVDNIEEDQEETENDVEQEEESDEEQEKSSVDNQISDQDICENDDQEMEHEDADNSVEEAAAKSGPETDYDGDNDIENLGTPNVSHDTAGRNRHKGDKSVEAGMWHDQNDLNVSSIGPGRNTSIRSSKSLNLNIAPQLPELARDSLRLSDGLPNSSAEGSGWDSHRTTRKTLRQTFGKDFTPRKSLRALVMEKSAKRQTLAKDATSLKMPRANSMELGGPSMGHDDFEMQEDAVEPEPEISLATRKATLAEFLRKRSREKAEARAKMEIEVRQQLERVRKPPLDPFKVQARPMTRRLEAKAKSKPRAKQQCQYTVPLEDMPEEFQADMKYKPPKRFCPRSAFWLTKHLYKFVETKLQPKYDYKARVRAEKFAQMLYEFVQGCRRREVACPDAVQHLKHEMARLKIVKTHYEFYTFFWEFMPKEVRIKVIPDLFNNIPNPPGGIYSDIIKNDE